MFTDFLYLLRSYGLAVSPTEWMTLMEALDTGATGPSLTSFYYTARSILVKSEADFDKFDQAFQAYFRDVQEATPEIMAQIWEWLRHSLPPLELTPEERERLAQKLGHLNLKELQELFQQREREQREEHHGGSHWIGTGGTSPFGHSGFHPTGIRVGGSSLNRSAIKIAAERRFQDYRTDVTLGVRQFEVALKRLRYLTSQYEGPATELDVEASIEATSRNAGRLELVFTRPRRNILKVLLLMDVGGSMIPYSQLCDQLFAALHRATHLKDFRPYYFHNCVYDQLYLNATCHPRQAHATATILHNLESTYRLILVGDATMAPSELWEPGGIIWWGLDNQEAGIVWLQRLRQHFRHSIWLNPIPASRWDHIYGRETLSAIRDIFPMYELTVDGLTVGMRRLLARQ